VAVSTLATAFFLVLMVSGARAAPYLKGGTSQDCRDTLQVARTAFYSKSFHVNDAVTLPKGRVEAVAQQLPGGDLSEDGGIAADATVFRKLGGAPDQSSRYQYWQMSPAHALRWVIEDEFGGMLGDSYSLYAIDARTDEQAFAQTVDKAPPVIDQSWLPPLMLRDSRTQTVWAVDIGPYSGVLNDWSVHAETDGAITTRCTIVFSPTTDATKLLPPPTRTLARLLDGTLGEGLNEGTLHPTYRIRSEVANAWANAALRPWAVTLTPYHSRHNVDLGLRNWSHGAKSFRALYRKIQAQYPLAEQALADLYVAKFGKTPVQAKALAARNLDLIYRDHFVFSQAYLHPGPNP
jgi:hypothetical protein